MGIERLAVAAWKASPLSRRRLDLSGVETEERAVRDICAQVRTRGDAALHELTERFDGWSGESLVVPGEEMASAWGQLPEAQRSALQFAASRIQTYHMAQPGPGSITTGGRLHLLTRPIRRAGLYVPGGRAAYPSTVLMTAIPAKVAGVREIALATPAGPDGKLPPAILAAAMIAGVTEVYRIGGAQAVAAFAYGTETVPPVDVIAGPGNIYVTLAKREVFGVVGIDAIAGPTEILILADDSAPAAFVAADLAAQLEHDPLAFALLVTPSAELAGAVEQEFESLLGRLDRRDIVQAAHCRIVMVDSLEQGVEIANDFGPEHLELVVHDPTRWLANLDNAGAIFVGPYAAVPLGDYVAGTNHSLPTAGSARFSSPLGVHTFLKRSSVAELMAADLEELHSACVTLANLEGLTAHAHAVDVRLEAIRRSRKEGAELA